MIIKKTTPQLAPGGGKRTRARLLRQAPIRVPIISRRSDNGNELQIEKEVGSNRDTYQERLAGYEADKAKLSRAGLSHAEYEQAVKALAETWGI